MAPSSDAGGYVHDAADLGHMRRYIGSEDHMQNDGVSAPMAAAHGYGRRHLIPEDHQVTREDHLGDEGSTTRLQRGGGRKLIVPFDHMKCDVLKPVEEIAPVKVPSRQDMKEAVKDWIITVHNMVVFNENRWDSEVNVAPKGCHWVVEALTEQKKSISREGPSARVVAEKLAMMPSSELRHFGIRFAGVYDPKQGGQAGGEITSSRERREKHGTFQDNRSLVSPGIANAFDGNKGPGTMSSTRRHPEAIQRRFIASGQDHFEHAAVREGDREGGRMDAVGRSHSKDDDFKGGIERGVGHGKRYIGTQDHLFGGGTI